MGTPGKQNSVVTVFSIWNGMIGTSTLTIPWAIKQASLIILLIVYCGSILSRREHRDSAWHYLQIPRFSLVLPTDTEIQPGLTYRYRDSTWSYLHIPRFNLVLPTDTAILPGLTYRYRDSTWSYLQIPRFNMVLPTDTVIQPGLTYRYRDSTWSYLQIPRFNMVLPTDTVIQPGLTYRYRDSAWSYLQIPRFNLVLPANTVIQPGLTYRYHDSGLPTKIPTPCFSPLEVLSSCNDDVETKQIKTQFSNVNSSLLVEAGFVNGIILVIVMAAVMTYSSYIIVIFCNTIASDKDEDTGMIEFSEVVRIILGESAGTLALICTLLTLLGVVIVYWILLTNYLYNIVVFIYSHIHDIVETNQTVTSSNYYDGDVVCKNEIGAVTSLPEYFKELWHEKYTVPLFLILLLFPLLNFKSPTFFTKFNALATISSIYFMTFVSVKAWEWGFHINKDLLDPTKPEFINNFRYTFPATTGVATMAFYIQSALIAILRNQKHPENNVRDLVLAFIAVCGTYIFAGVTFYATFPLGEDCLADNLLNNLPPRDILSFVARVFLFFQIICAFPLLVYVIRIQLLSFVFHSMWPSVAHVMILNAIIVTICVLFAVFEPNVGRIVSFAGAFCGLAYGIALPCITYIVSSHKQGTLTKLKVIVHCVLIGIGALNFIGQFVIIGHTS